MPETIVHNILCDACKNPIVDEMMHECAQSTTIREATIQRTFKAEKLLKKDPNTAKLLLPDTEVDSEYEDITEWMRWNYSPEESC